MGKGGRTWDLDNIAGPPINSPWNYPPLELLVIKLIKSVLYCLSLFELDFSFLKPKHPQKIEQT